MKVTNSHSWNNELSRLKAAVNVGNGPFTTKLPHSGTRQGATSLPVEKTASGGRLSTDSKSWARCRVVCLKQNVKEEQEERGKRDLRVALFDALFDVNGPFPPNSPI
ncbi:hypothetical protein KIN20_019978 [Parelaphostrongylus tenuis]|uniref:Uncharacterized protein n=1 Tax=Parelaphostrongylus tenuis TaxID=148309 RepID=A0AAD5QTA7_PARTN|nr:hypothetical protein KIN20_019978 [Parelaphostrongylus tenuis]